jgi:phosphatidate cytidylyltransferase
MLGKRIITAIIGAAAAIYVVNYGQWLFAGMVLLLTLLAWHEFYNMMVRREYHVSYFIGFICIITLWGTVWLGNSKETVAVLLLSTLLVLLKMVFASASYTFQDAVFTLVGIYYIGLSFAHLILLRFTDFSLYLPTSLGAVQAGEAYLLLAFVGTWASDTFAFFIGSKLGKHKLAPAISPGKTWEGMVGGLAGSIIIVALCGKFLNLQPAISVGLGLLIGVVAPLGDLVESSIKRFAGVKDSGRLLPGHGGVLDRFDSIMFVVPAAYYFIYIFILP